MGWLPAELLADGLGEVAELGALTDVDDRVVVAGLHLDGGVVAVDGVLERPGGLLGEADLGVGGRRLPAAR